MILLLAQTAKWDRVTGRFSIRQRVRLCQLDASGLDAVALTGLSDGSLLRHHARAAIGFHAWVPGSASDAEACRWSLVVAVWRLLFGVIVAVGWRWAGPALVRLVLGGGLRVTVWTLG